MDVLRHVTPSTRSRRPSRSYDNAPCVELRPLHALALHTVARRGEHVADTLLLDHDRTVRVEHDEIARTDDGAADLDRLVEDADDTLLGSSGSDPPRPDRQTELAELLESRIAASTSSAATPRAFACVASRSPTRATGSGSGSVRTRTSPGRA